MNVTNVRHPIYTFYAQRSLLDRLPNELLALIKDSFYKYDLVGHINFFRLSPRTASFYPAVDDPYWEKLCYMNGLGSIPNERIEQSDWFGIALDCAMHAVRCTHPGCGRARLEKNAKHMADYLEDNPENTIPAVVNAKDVVTDTPANTVFEHIAFRKTTQLLDFIEVTAHLRSANGELDAVEAHPPVQRSYATLPPVGCMSLNEITTQAMIPLIMGKDGVTVEHVLQDLCESLCDELSVRDVLELLDSVDSSEVFPQSWTTQERFGALGHLADWFNVIDWKGFVYVECTDDTFYYSWEFETNPEALEGLSPSDSDEGGVQ